MKKTIALLSGLVALLFIASNGYTAVFAQNATTGVVTIDATTNMGVANVEFSPSTNVLMTGSSSSTAFAAEGRHNQVVGKDSGKQFGMASDENTMFFRDISTAAAEDLVAADTNAATAFPGWTTM